MSFKRKNWAKQEAWNPLEIAIPSNFEELRQVIVNAKAKRFKIRAIGSLHSFNALCETAEINLETYKLCKVLKIDKEAMLVRAEGGIKMAALIKALAEEGLTLPNQGYILHQSLAGALATATHGSGKTGTLSSFIEEVELINAEGELLVINADNNLHLFNALVVNLGCLGIVYALTLRVVPLHKLYVLKYRGSQKLHLKELPKLLEAGHLHLYLDPYSDQMLIFHATPTEKPLENRLIYHAKRLFGEALGVLSFNFLPALHVLIPLLPKAYIAINASKPCVDYSNKILSTADLGTYVEEEIAIPFEQFPFAIDDIREIVNHYSSRKLRAVVVILVRFVEPDLYGYLSPTLNRRSVYITLITLPKKGYRDLFKEYETAMLKYGGRPHWGKIHTLTKEMAAMMYQDNYLKFVDARHELDPDGMFSNALIDFLF